MQKVTTIGRDSPKKSSKKEKKGKAKKKEEDKKADVEKGTIEPKPKTPTVETADELPEVDETTVGNLSEQERKDYAAKLKAAGNTAYGSKDYNKAIELYGKAIICKPDPIFYSNRAACYNALGQWEKVIEDTTAAINLDNEYVKALNRRANAYEHMEKYSEALLDFTASCIIDSFRNESSAQAVERLLKKVAEAKGKAILAEKDKRLPSPTFVTNYLQSFRARPPPAGLEESVELPEDTGKGQLQLGLRSMAKKTGDGYEEAAAAFDKALVLGDLGDLEAFAYNMRGTFRYLRGENIEALSDLTKSVDLQPSLTQSFIKRASMHLELGISPFLDCFNLANSLQETKTPPQRISRRRWPRTMTTLISTTTAPNSTLFLASSQKPPRTTRNRLISTQTSSSRTSNSVSHNIRWDRLLRRWLHSEGASRTSSRYPMCTTTMESFY